MLREFLGNGFVYAIFSRGIRLVFVLDAKFPEILPGQQPQKICRRARTLVLVTIGLGLNSCLQGALLAGPAACRWVDLWLTHYIYSLVMRLSSQRVCYWLAVWLACPPATWLVDRCLGVWLLGCLVVKWLAA